MGFIDSAVVNQAVHTRFGLWTLLCYRLRSIQTAARAADKFTQQSYVDNLACTQDTARIVKKYRQKAHIVSPKHRQENLTKMHVTYHE